MMGAVPLLLLLLLLPAVAVAVVPRCAGSSFLRLAVLKPPAANQKTNGAN
jgi:hypothetical protein